jgi:hypothetical protein
MHEVIGLGFSRAHENNKEPTRELLPERERVLLQSISNQTHDQPICSTPQRSEILSTMGRPHPPLKSVRGLGSEGSSKPGPGSHTLPRTDLPETITESKIWSFSESPAWRTAIGHQLTHHQSGVLQLLRRQKFRQPVQGMACVRDDLGLRLESQINLSYHQKAPADRPALKRYVPSGTPRYTLYRAAQICSNGEERGVYARLVTSISNRNLL